jgi:hypothetical protein
MGCPLWREVGSVICQGLRPISFASIYNPFGKVGDIPSPLCNIYLFADDHVIVATTEDELQKTAYALNNIATKHNL